MVVHISSFYLDLIIQWASNSVWEIQQLKKDITWYEQVVKYPDNLKQVQIALVHEKQMRATWFFFQGISKKKKKIKMIFFCKINSLGTYVGTFFEVS